MLKGQEFGELYGDWLCHIVDSEVRAAFQFFVGLAACNKSFVCYPRQKGLVRDFRFHNLAGDQEFAFIVNKRSLLFYILLPAVRSGRHDFELVKQLLPCLQVNTAGEWTIKVASVADAKAVQRALGLS